MPFPRQLIASGALGGSSMQFDASCITTGAQTLTFAELDVATGQTLVVHWGDGQSNQYTGEGTNITHNYAGAGTYYISMTPYTAITRLTCVDAKFGCPTNNIGKLTNLNLLYLAGGQTNVKINAGEIGGLKSVTYLNLQSLANCVIGAGEIGGLTSLTYVYMYNLANCVIGAGEFGGLTSLTNLYLNLIPNCTIGANELGSLTNLTSLRLYALANCALQASYGGKLTQIIYQNSLTQANVGAVLFAIHTASLTRTAVNGTIDLAGTNAVPSGVLQAATSCPVTGATPGKEIAHELVNDGCGSIANHWVSVAVA